MKTGVTAAALPDGWNIAARTVRLALGLRGERVDAGIQACRKQY